MSTKKLASRLPKGTTATLIFALTLWDTGWGTRINALPSALHHYLSYNQNVSLTPQNPSPKSHGPRKASRHLHSFPSPYLCLPTKHPLQKLEDFPFLIAVQLRVEIPISRPPPSPTLPRRRSYIAQDPITIAFSQIKE